MDSLFLKCYNSFQNKYDMKDTYNFAPRHLIFKLQQEAFKFNYTCVSWSSPKTGKERIFYNWKIKNVSFLQTIAGKNSTFLLINLFFSLKARSGQRKFSATEISFKMMKNDFYFTLKAFFVLKIFKVLS